MFKLNTVICISTDLKKNKVYMIDVTTQKIYSHPQSVKVNTNLYAMIGIILASIISGFANQFREYLYLNEVFQNFKFLFIGFGILMGFSISWLASKKRYIFHLDEYLMHYPQSEEVNNRREIIEKANFMAVVSLVFILGGIIGSVMIFAQFLNKSNLSTYIWAVLLLAISSFLVTGVKHFIFIFGLKSEMNPKEAAKEVSETAITRKHPWEEESQDENETWKAKMLKLESEMNSSKE